MNFFIKKIDGCLQNHFSQRALQEYIKTIAWYKYHSLYASENLVAIIQNTLTSIAESPYSFKNSYKHFYETKTKRFPFSIVYLIDEEKQIIVITSIFHNKRNPARKYR